MPETERSLAPRQELAYHCERPRCVHTPLMRAFAAGTKAPDAVACRCGGTARLDGAPQDAPVELPGYTGNGGKTRDHPCYGISPMEQLLKRRSKKDLEAILAERLAVVKGLEAAR